MSRLQNVLMALYGERLFGERRSLPDRRDVETIKLEDHGHKWFASIGRFEDGKVAEVFLNTAKSGELLRLMSRDCAIAASLALQYGCSADTLRLALTRDGDKGAASPLSKALDIALGWDEKK